MYLYYLIRRILLIKFDIHINISNMNPIKNRNVNKTFIKYVNQIVFTSLIMDVFFNLILVNEIKYLKKNYCLENKIERVITIQRVMKRRSKELMLKLKYRRYRAIGKN